MRNFTILTTIIIFFSVLIMTSMAYADTGDILKQFQAPNPDNFVNGRAIAFDGENLWYSFGGAGWNPGGYGQPADTFIYKVDTNGNPLGNFDVGVSIGALAWDGHQLWAGVYNFTDSQGNNILGNVYTINPNNGQKTLRFTINFNPDENCFGQTPGLIDGLEYNPVDDTLWITDDGGRRSYHVALNGRIITDALLPNNVCNSGIATTGENMWYVNFNDNRIYKQLQRGGDFLFGFDSPVFAEDIEFDNETFAPNCALWINEATYGSPRLTAVEVPCAVILVHGTYADDTTWTETRDGYIPLRDKLESIGYDVFLIGELNNKRGYVPNNGPVKKSSKQLSDAIKNLRNRIKGTSIDIIAHSQGGLVTEWYMADDSLYVPEYPVRRVITLGTTHQGSVIADISLFSQLVGGVNGLRQFSLRGVNDQGRRDQIPNSPFLKELHQRFNARDAQFFTVAGNGGPAAYETLIDNLVSIPGLVGKIPLLSSTLRGIGRFLKDYGQAPGELLSQPFTILTYEQQLKDPNDGVVSIKAAKLAIASNFLANNTVHSTTISKKKPVLYENPLIQEFIVDILLRGGSDKLPPNTDPPAGIDYQAINNVINSSESQIYEIQFDPLIDLDTEKRFLLAYNNTDLDLTITSPNNMTYNSSTIDDDFIFVKNNSLGYIFIGVGNDQAGTWIANITSTSDINFTLYSMADSSLYIESLTPNSFEEQINLTAIVINGTEPLFGLNVTSIIIKPDNNTEILQLYDDGLHNDNLTNDGIYGNIFENTFSEGEYYIGFFVNGTFNDKYSERLDFTIFSNFSVVGGILTGYVLDISGDPINDVFISATGISNDTTSTDINGSYSILLEGNGTYQIEFNPPPLGEYFPNNVSVNITDNQITMLNVTLTSGGILTGFVTDQNGDPIFDILVEISGPVSDFTITDLDGYYFINLLVDGIYNVSVIPPIGLNASSFFTIIEIIEDEITELNITLFVYQTPKAELLITYLTFSPDTPTFNEGDIITFNATITNIGNTSVFDNVYVNYSINSSVVGTNFTFGLNINELKNVTFDWVALTGSNFQLTAEVDPDNIIDEYNEANNNFSVSMPITVYPLPVITDIQCEKNNTQYVDCSEVKYRDILSSVKVTCTDQNFNVEEVRFRLINIEDNKIFFDVFVNENINNTWYYNNDDILIEDSGNFGLEVACTNSNNGTRVVSSDWFIDFGYLETSLIEPLENITVKTGREFNFSSSVTCIGGECGNVSATLDPEQEQQISFSLDPSNCYSVDRSVCTEGSFYIYLPYPYDTLTCNFTDTLGSDFVVTKVAIDHVGFNTNCYAETRFYVDGTLVGNNTETSCICTPGDRFVPITSQVFEDGWPSYAYDGLNNFTAVTGSEAVFDDDPPFFNITLTYIRASKGAIPMNNGTPFYTLDNNPRMPEYLACLQDMRAGDACEQTWRVIPTATNGTYEFFTIYDAMQYPIASNTTPKINVSVFETATIIHSVECNVNDNWEACTNIAYSDVVSSVRINCTNDEVGIDYASMKLENTEDNTILAQGSTPNLTDGYYVIDIGDLTIEDSGTFDLEASCIDNEGAPKVDIITWIVPWGGLEPYLIAPVNATEVQQNKTFTFSSGVSCIGGECGNVSATLDPDGGIINYTVSTTNYNFIDITATGINSGLTGDDNSVLIPIGFNFTFYNETYDKIRVSTNGYLTFGTSGGVYDNAPIPSTSQPNSLIASFWDDLNFNINGIVYYELQGNSPNRKLIIEYVNAAHYGGMSDGVTFEVILNENRNEIIFQYADVSFGNPSWNNGSSATVGVENQNGTIGTQYSYNAPSLYDGLALLFKPVGIGKGIIPMNSGEPFYTYDQNPRYPQNLSCLRDMKTNDVCEQSWHVNATGEINSSWEFFTIYEPLVYAGVGENETDIVNITIIAPIEINDTEAPVITLISPPENFTETSSNAILFEYSAYDELSDIAECSLLIDGTLNRTDYTIQENVTQDFTQYLENGIYDWQISCKDTFNNEGFSETRTLIVDVPLPNNPPVMDAIGNKFVDEGDTLIIDVNATDPDNDTLTYHTNAGDVLPSYFTFNESTGLFTWMPTFDDAGEYNVTFNVTDGELWDSETIIITVSNVNRPPELDQIGNWATNENETLTIDVNATDPDNDVLTYYTNADEVLPSSFTFDQNTGLFEWTPTFDDSGEYNVTFNVTDGELWDEETITITVNDVILNQPPILEPIGDQQTNEAETLIIDVNASDPDNDSLTYFTNAGEVLPSAFIFDSVTGLFTWTPTYFDSGEYNVMFNVTDGELWDSETITITVIDVLIDVELRDPYVSTLSNFTPNSTIYVEFDAFNNENVTLYNVSLKLDTNSSDPNIEFVIPVFRPYQEINFILHWNYSQAGTYEPFAFIDYTNALQEYNENNNIVEFGTMNIVPLQCLPPVTGNWRINESCTLFNHVYVINGNVTVEPAGNLTLRNVSLLMNGTYDGHRKISVNRGAMQAIGSNFTSLNPYNAYSFEVQKGSRFVVKDSQINHAGYKSTPFNMKNLGLFISADNVLIENNRVTCAEERCVGIILNSSVSSQISGNFINISGVTGYSNGVYLQSGSIANTIFNNTVYAYGNESNGIYVVSSPNNTFSENRIFQSGGNDAWGLLIHYASPGSIATGNQITTYGNLGLGIWIQNSLAFLDENTVNTYGTNAYGIYLENASNTPVIDSLINAQQAYDFYIQGTGDYLVLNTTFDKDDVFFGSGQQMRQAIIKKFQTIGLMNNLDSNVITTATLTVKWYVDAYVAYENATPAEGALVEGHSIPQNIIEFSALTDAAGRIPAQNATEYMQNINGKTFYTPHLINVTKDNYSASEIINITGSVFMNFILTEQIK